MATRGMIGFTLVVTCALPMVLLLVERSTGGKVIILLLLVMNLFATNIHRVHI